MDEPTADILALLRCPVTGSPLAAAAPALLEQVNAAIAKRSLLTRLSEVVEQPVDAGLVNADRSLLYRIEQGAIVLLAGDAIEIWELTDSA